jgi:serine/threonine-protein kinase RsbW/stage II sporulation protein AB (anti-sigma F factor)
MDLPRPQPERGDLDLVLYERLLPAVPDSDPLVRLELQAVLERHRLAADRLFDIALLISEAATNAVLHAYPDGTPGPLYVSATLRGRALTTSICDSGPGMRGHVDSPGMGVGIALMTTLCDQLRVCSDPPDGTCVHATFEAVATASSPNTTTEHSRADLYGEYLRRLRAVHAALAQDTQAAVAQARLAVAHARRGRRERDSDRPRVDTRRQDRA